MNDVTYGKHNYKDGESTLHMASKLLANIIAIR